MFTFQSTTKNAFSMLRTVRNAPLQCRNMSTLKALARQIKSVKNLQKITKSMKMVSASKYAQAENRLRKARPYGIGSKQFYDKAEIVGPEEGPKRLIVAVTSDKGTVKTGLCGGCHSGIARFIRKDIEKTGGKNLMVSCVGDKARSLLRNYYPEKILFVASEMGRKPPTFRDASLICSQIWKSGYDYTHGTIIYNTFRSVVSYKITEQPLYSMATVMASPKLVVYDDIETDMMQSYMEFSMVSLIFFALMEGACSEQSSRMTAMENASKNAAEMIDNLSLTYNRTRQAVITRELIEIISGAAAL